MDNTAHFTAVFALDRHDIPAVAHGNDTLLQIFGGIHIADHALQTVADAVFGRADLLAQVVQRIGSSISHRIRCKDRTGNLLFKPRLRCQRVEKIIRRQYIVLRCPVPAGEVLEIAQRACHHQQLAHGQHTALDRTGHKLADALHPAKPGRAVLDKQCIDRIRLLQRIAHFVRVALRLDYKQICPCFLTYTAFGGAGNDLIQFQCF